MMAEHKKKSVGRDALILPGRSANHLPQTYKRICRGRCLHRPAGGSLLHLPLFIRLCVGQTAKRDFAADDLRFSPAG